VRAPAAIIAAFLWSAGAGKTVTTYQPADVIFSQGDAAGTVLYIQKAAAKLAVLSRSGKEAVVAMLGPGDFFASRRWPAIPLRLTAAFPLIATTVLIVPSSR
jgi:CRP/FNR family cyclic AMP-dependent transcriptional regulator